MFRRGMTVEDVMDFLEGVPADWEFKVIVSPRMQSGDLATFSLVRLGKSVALYVEPKE